MGHAREHSKRVGLGKEAATGRFSRTSRSSHEKHLRFTSAVDAIFRDLLPAQRPRAAGLSKMRGRLIRPGGRVFARDNGRVGTNGARLARSYLEIKTSRYNYEAIITRGVTGANEFPTDVAVVVWNDVNRQISTRRNRR